MNIIVDLNYPIKDGTEVVFRSPVDCSQVTGLLVNYYENGKPGSKEFAFADANGNNVGDIDHLFGEDVPVKVILDVTKKSMAFVQNADTNAYLEGRFAELEDKIGTGGGGSGGGGSSVVFGYGAPDDDTECKLGSFYFDKGDRELYLYYDFGAYGEKYWAKISVDEDKIVQKVLAALPSAEEVGF